MVYETNILISKGDEYTEKGFTYYSEYEEGDKVKVEITFYPYKEFYVLN